MQGMPLTVGYPISLTGALKLNRGYDLGYDSGGSILPSESNETITGTSRHAVNVDTLLTWYTVYAWAGMSRRHSVLRTNRE